MEDMHGGLYFGHQKASICFDSNNSQVLFSLFYFSHHPEDQETEHSAFPIALLDFQFSHHYPIEIHQHRQELRYPHGDQTKLK